LFFELSKTEEVPFPRTLGVTSVTTTIIMGFVRRVSVYRPALGLRP